jgi:hypothetical protein
MTAAQRIAEVGMILPPQATPTGWAGLAWRGAWWFDGTASDGVTPLPVPIAAPRKLLRVQPAFTLCRERWDPRDVEVVDGLALATSVRAACFSMRYAPTLDQAVAALDMAAFHDEVSIEEAWAWVDLHPSYTGIEQARQALALGDENSWSPRETPMRMLWEERGFGRPRTNHPVFDLTGRFVGTPDMIDPIAGAFGEYEGGLHLEGSRRAVDVRREADFRALGLESVTMVAADWPNPDAFLRRLREAYARAAARPASERRWTLELPDWWIPTFTVEQRRALTESQRRRLLKHRLTRPPMAGHWPG